MKITSIVPLVVNVSEKTNWFFVRVETDAGLSGLGEATLSGGWESVQHTCLQRLGAKLVGKEVEQELPGLQVYPHSPGGLAWNSVLSAVEQALIDICARHAGVPIHALFGKPLRSSVRVYANINRMTRDRSPSGFARNASAKVAEGYTAVKIAPFDGVYWTELASAEGRQHLALGIDRVLATRDAIGPDVDLLIDCHWRFDERTACQVISGLEPAKLFWAECMVSERPEHHAALARVRAHAAERGVRLTGAERQVGVAGFEAIAHGKLLDVVMPDVKYAGGYAETLRIAERTAKAGIAYSPHNPTGPVCTFASLHLCALAPNFLILERQSETSIYDDIIVGSHPSLVNGCYAIPERPGLGIDLNPEVITAHPYKPPSVESLSDPRLG